MKSVKVAASLVVVLAVAVAVLIAQGRRGRAPRGFGGVSPVESMWAALAFEVNVDDPTLQKLRPHFQNARDEQGQLIRGSAGDFQAVAQGMRKIRTELNEKIKTVLTEEEAQKLADWEASRRQMRRPPGGSRARQPRQGVRGGGSSSLGNPPLANNDAEKRILETAEQVTRHLNVPLQDGRLIRLLTEAIGAKNAVEIGTSTGYSGLWFALGLRPTDGKLTTFEIDSGRAATARENFRKAGVEGLVTVVEGNAHETVKKLSKPIDIVFLDADKSGYLDYLEKLLPLLRPGGLILAHNIRNRAQNPNYVDAVTTNPGLETILVNTQMAVTLKKR